MSANILLLPELREMIALNDAAEMRVFCSALHPASTAEFLQELEPSEIWVIFRAIDPALRAARVGVGGVLLRDDDDTGASPFGEVDGAHQPGDAAADD